MEVPEVLTSQVKDTARKVEKIYLQNVCTQDIIEEFEFILLSLKTNKIQIKSVKTLKEEKKSKENISDEKWNNNDDKHTLKKRNRPLKEQNTELCVQPERLDDDSSSTTRNRRTAAQVADQKLTQVHNYMKATKLRRPTDFDEKRSTSTTQSPPAKCRRTRRKQSAGSSSSIEETILTEGIGGKIIENGHQQNSSEVGNNTELVNNCLSNKCKVAVERINSPAVKRLTRTSSKRISGDLFDDNTKESGKVKHTNNKAQSKKHLIKKKEEHCITLSEPVLCRSPESETEFNGFNVQSGIEHPVALLHRNTFTKQETHSDSELLLIKTKKIKQRLTRTNANSAGEEHTTEVIEIETKSVRSKTKTTRNKTKDDHNEKEDILNNMDIEDHKDDSPIIRTRTRVIKKKQPEDSNNGFDNAEKDPLNKEEEKEESPVIRSRTRIIRSNKDKQVIEVDSASCSTETDKKASITSKDEHSESSEEDSNARFRTKTIKKEVIQSGLKEPENIKKINIGLPASPVSAKGELVKKRIEDFEKMKTKSEDEEEKPAGRLTRNAVKNKTQLVEDKKDKLNRNAMTGLKPKVPSIAEGARFTPLGYRPTPDDKTGSALGSKVNRHTPAENTTVLVQKQAVEEAERKKREEERLKRQTKEEEAKKKKEKTLKATAEEKRKKRENRLLKVTAAREAADREKALLAAKAEKEKEDKMLQLQAEKKRQQEEQQKKKLLMQQKALEHEERRKQEEAARLAKLREQEEEHKRVLAMKERELQKQQKAAELRLAEAEKNKHQQQNSKLGKLAAINSANMKLQQGMTPSEKAPQSYNITPAREDRPLLKPKTENDYGIDDANSDDSSDEESRPKKIIPAWAQSKNRERLMLVNNYIPKEIWELFMECNSSPDITEIFAGNPVKKRMRTSSAVWRTPPRCTHFQHKN